MMKVAVVILNWNGRNYLEKFLPKVIEYSRSHATIYVADNNSTDDSVSFIRDNYPKVKLIINQENGGFAKGYNDALLHVNAEYYVLLNSDIEVTPNWINPIVKLMDEDEKIAACQPKILAYNNQTSFEHAGAAGGYLDKNCYPFCRGRIFMTTEKDTGQYNDRQEIFWATGACMFIRSKYYHELGGLDEDFFAHMEEIDLCWRMKNKGLKIMFSPDAFVYHVGGGTLDYMSPKKTYLNFRNSLFMILKNHKKNVIGMLLKRLVLDGIAGVKFLAEGRVKHTIMVLKAHLHFYASLGKFTGKRNKIKFKTSPNKKGTYNGSIVSAYFFKKINCFSKLDKNLFD